MHMTMESIRAFGAEAQQVVISEIFKAAQCCCAELTLGALLQAYDSAIIRHGICASDLTGIQIYRSLLQWGREQQGKRPGTIQGSTDMDLEPLRLRNEIRDDARLTALGGVASGGALFSHPASMQYRRDLTSVGAVGPQPTASADIDHASDGIASAAAVANCSPAAAPVAHVSAAAAAVQRPRSGRSTSPQPPRGLLLVSCSSGSGSTSNSSIAAARLHSADFGAGRQSRTAPPQFLEDAVRCGGARGSSRCGGGASGSPAQQPRRPPEPAQLPSCGSIAAPLHKPLATEGQTLSSLPHLSPESANIYLEAQTLDIAQAQCVTPKAGASATVKATELASVALTPMPTTRPPPSTCGLADTLPRASQGAAFNMSGSIMNQSGALAQGALDCVSTSMLIARHQGPAVSGFGGHVLEAETKESAFSRLEADIARELRLQQQEHPSRERGSALRDHVGGSAAGGSSGAPSGFNPCMPTVPSIEQVRKSWSDIARPRSNLSENDAPSTLSYVTPLGLSHISPLGRDGNNDSLGSNCASRLYVAAAEAMALTSDSVFSSLPSRLTIREGPANISEPDAHTILAEALAYRHILRRAMRSWRASAHLRLRLCRHVEARNTALLGVIAGAWHARVKMAQGHRAEHALASEHTRQRHLNHLLVANMSAWRSASVRRVQLRRQRTSVQRLVLEGRFFAWAQASLKSFARTKGLRRVLLRGWHDAAHLRRSLRKIAIAYTRDRCLRHCVGALGKWTQIRRRRHMEVKRAATVLDTRRSDRLESALAIWYRRTRELCTIRTNHMANRTQLTRRSKSMAIEIWRNVSEPRALRRRSATSLCRWQRRRRMLNALGVWLNDFTARRRLQLPALHVLRKRACQWVMRCALESWRVGARTQKMHVSSIQSCHCSRLVALVVAILRTYAQERKVFRVYKGWSDIHWVRSMLVRGFMAWRVWLFELGGRVPFMNSEAQLWASFCWLRFSAFARGPCATSAAGAALGARRSACARGPEGSAPRAMLNSFSGPTPQAVAVELLLQSGTIAALHPHRHHARWGRVAGLFVRALIRRVLHYWLGRARRLRQFLLRGVLLTKVLVISAWRRRASGRSRARACQAQVGSRILAWRRRVVLARWLRRYHRHTGLSRGLGDIVKHVHRSVLLRVTKAWRMVQVTDRRLRCLCLTVASRRDLLLQHDVLDAWTACCAASLQQALMVRLSGLYLRKISLRAGLSSLRTNVQSNARRRSATRARLRRLQIKWLQIWRSAHQCSRDLRRREQCGVKWAIVKLQLRVMRAWLSSARLAVMRQQLVVYHRQVRIQRSQLRSIRTLLQYARARYTRRVVEVRVAWVTGQRRRCYAIRRWRNTSLGYIARRFVKGQSYCQLATLAIAAWQSVMREARDKDVDRIGVIVVRRYHLLLSAWRREVSLTQLAQDTLRRLSKRKLRSGLLFLHYSSRRRRQLRTVSSLVTLERRRVVSTFYVASWRTRVACISTWRASAACREASATKEWARRCVAGWRARIVHRQALASCTHQIGQRVRARISHVVLREMWKAAGKALGLRALATASCRACMGACVVAWHGIARKRVRCHLAAGQVKDKLLSAQRPAVVLSHWKARSEGRREFRGRLSVFRASSIGRRLRLAIVAWRAEVEHFRHQRNRIGRTVAMLEAKQRRWALRRLALWFVYCIDRNAVLLSALRLLTRAHMRSGIASFRAGLVQRQQVCNQTNVSIAWRCTLLYRVHFRWWRGTIAFERRRTALQAAANTFRESWLLRFFVQRWLVESRIARRLYERTIFGRCHLDTQEKARILRHWLLCSRSRRGMRIQVQNAVFGVRLCRVARALRTIRTRLQTSWDIQTMLAHIQQKKGWAISWSRIELPRPRDRAVAGVQVLADLLAMGRIWPRWRQVVKTRQRRSQEFEHISSHALATTKRQCKARFLVAWRSLIAHLQALRSETSGRVGLRLVARLLRAWALVAKRAQERLLELEHHARAFVAKKLVPVLIYWAMSFLLRKGMTLKSLEVHRLRRIDVVARHVRVWGREVTARARGRQSVARCKRVAISSALVTWREAFQSKRRLMALACRTARQVLRPAFHSWRAASFVSIAQSMLASEVLSLWRATAISSAKRRSSQEALRRTRSAQFRRDALAHWRRRRRTDNGIALKRYARCTTMVAALRRWRRWADISGTAAEKLQAACGSLVAFRRRRGWQLWRRRAVLWCRVAACRAAAAALWRKTSLRRSWLAWALYKQRRVRKRQLAPGHHHALFLAKRVFRSWLCSFIAEIQSRYGLLRAVCSALRSWNLWTARSRRCREIAAADALETVGSAFCFWRARWERGRSFLPRVVELARAKWQEVVRLAFVSWRAHRLWKEQVRITLPGLDESRRFRLVKKSWSLWCDWVASSRKSFRSGVAVAASAATGERLRVILRWRRAAAAARLSALIARIEERCLQEKVAEAFRTVVSRHLGFQEAVDCLVARHPNVREALRTRLMYAHEARRDSLVKWRSHTVALRQELMLRRDLRRAQRRCSLRSCLRHLDRMRRARLAQRDLQRQISAFQKADTVGLRACMLGIWARTARALRQERLAEDAAITENRRRLLRVAWKLWFQNARACQQHREAEENAKNHDRGRTLRRTLLDWSQTASRAASVRAIEERTVNTRKVVVLGASFQWWRRWARAEASLGQAKLRCSARRHQRKVRRVLGAWADVAVERATAATRQLLKADDFRTQMRCEHALRCLRNWRSEVVRARTVMRRARLSKVFTCWHLHTQEEILLRRYLKECATANFSSTGSCEAGRRSRSTSSVEPADFAQLYERMAAQRFTFVDVLADGL